MNHAEWMSVRHALDVLNVDELVRVIAYLSVFVDLDIMLLAIDTATGMSQDAPGSEARS